MRSSGGVPRGLLRPQEGPNERLGDAIIKRTSKPYKNSPSRCPPTREELSKVPDIFVFQDSPCMERVVTMRPCRVIQNVQWLSTQNSCNNSQERPSRRIFQRAQGSYGRQGIQNDRTEGFKMSRISSNVDWVRPRVVTGLRHDFF